MVDVRDEISSGMGQEASLHALKQLSRELDVYVLYKTKIFEESAHVIFQ